MASSLQDILLRVKEAADIVQIVGQYVPLKRAGSKYLGVCPFHNDRHPSMNVNPRMGIYKCFACGAGGDAIKFVQEFERVGFVEALRLVAGKAGIAIPENLSLGDKGDSDKTAMVVQANQIALQIYVESLEKSQVTLDYLQERGLNRETVKHFQIGYAPESSDLILQRAAAKKVPKEAFIEAGILGEAAGGRVFDRFAGRLMFPIFNLSSRVIGFGGRIPPGRDGAKYINTPESPLYSKSRVLYGFNFARQSIDQSGEAVIVEGYMDLVSLWQAGVHNAVAVCGTALTREHAQMLMRFAKKVYLFFDGDTAGRQAVRRSLEPLLAQGVEVRVPVLPASEDPDSFVKKNSPDALPALQTLFAAAEDLPSFLIRDHGKSVDSLSPEEKDVLVKSAAEVLQHNPSVEVRDAHLQSLRKSLGLRPAPINRTQPRGTNIPTAAPTARVPGLFVPGASLTVRAEAVPEWQLLQLLLSYPDIAVSRADAMDHLAWFMDERVRELFDITLGLLAEKKTLSLRELRELVPESLQEVLASLEIAEGGDPERIRRQLKEYAEEVESRYLQLELQRLKQTMGGSIETDNKTKEIYFGLYKRLQAFNARKGPLGFNP